jgi:hypothetical protein
MRRFTLLLLAAASLAGCDNPPPSNSDEDAKRGLLRAKMAAECMATLPEGPRSTTYNDWDEVVAECTVTAYYKSNGCTDPDLCLRELFPRKDQS